MKTRLHLKALVLTLGLSCLQAVQAGVPVVEATNIIYSPLEYMEIAEQTVNTIQQIENQIMMYMNQIKQIEQAAQNLKGSLDFKDIESISDLQYRISRLKNAYREQIESYNRWAKATNAYTNFTCDWVNLYLNCTKEQAKRAKDVEEAILERKNELLKIKQKINTQLDEDQQKLNKVAQEISSSLDEKSGTKEAMIKFTILAHKANMDRKTEMARIESLLAAINYYFEKQAEEREFEKKREMEEKEKRKDQMRVISGSKLKAKTRNDMY